MTEALRAIVKSQIESVMGKTDEDWTRINHGYRLKIRSNGVIVYDTGTIVVDGPKNELFTDLKSLALKAKTIEESKRKEAWGAKVVS